jgi:hypothetical protein
MAADGRDPDSLERSNHCSTSHSHTEHDATDNHLSDRKARSDDDRPNRECNVGQSHGPASAEFVGEATEDECGDDLLFRRREGVPEVRTNHGQGRANDGGVVPEKETSDSRLQA